VDPGRLVIGGAGSGRLVDVIPAELLVAAYSSGYFPMADEEGEIRWYSPDPRGIIPLGAFHVPARLARTLRQGRFRVTFDTAFRAVIEACSRDRDEGSWINAEIVDSYCALHEQGLAHAVEVWLDGRLAGGLYGVGLGGAFFGESMFHTARDASKVALCALVERLRTRGYRLLDVQWVTPHLERFGAAEISRRRYLQLLRQALAVEVRFDG
jgi:leucyl/phenylalanyl-tRNA--protein transferase